MNRYRESFSMMVVVILAVTPAVIWTLTTPLAPRLSGFTSIVLSIGQIFGLVGMALFSINFILSSRLSFLDKSFGGLNRVYIHHHLIGITAFCFLLLHPLFLAMQYASVSLVAVLRFLIFPGPLAIFFGQLALWSMILLMIITLYLNWRYQNWKLSHKFLGLAFFLAGLHVFLVPSDVAINPILRWYVLGLASLGLAAYLWRTVFRGYRTGEYIYTVTEVHRVGDKVIEITLSPSGRPMRHQPGQFAFMRIQDPNFSSESHPFSITASSADHDLKFGVKELGDFTIALRNIHPGVRVSIEGPFGTFSYRRGVAKNQIWLAGGIGITPFLGMVRSLRDEPDAAYSIDLYYVVRSKSEAVFADELTNLAGKIPGFRFHPYFSDDRGLFSTDVIRAELGGATGEDVFLCGPPGFMTALKNQLTALGVGKRYIHSEEFQL